MKRIFLAFFVLGLSQQGFGFTSLSSADVDKKGKAELYSEDCPKAGTFVLNDTGVTKCKRAETVSFSIDGDAENMGFVVDNYPDCTIVTQYSVANQDNCFVSEVTSFDVDGNLVVTGHDYGYRNSSANAFTVITRGIRDGVRGLLNVYCSSAGLDSWMFAQVTGNIPRLCGASYCSNTFGSSNGCRTACDAEVTKNCGGSCIVSTVQDCGTTSCESAFPGQAGCIENCHTWQTTGLGCFTE